MVHMSCMLDKQGYMHTHAYTHPHTQVYARVHTHMHTQISNIYCFSIAAIICECTTVFLYTYMLGTFARWQKATVGFVMSVCVHLQGTVRHPLNRFSLNLRRFLENLNKIQVWLNCGKNNWYFSWRPTYIYETISLNLSWNVKCFRQNL
jgi:hypothetical protein